MRRNIFRPAIQKWFIGFSGSKQRNIDDFYFQHLNRRKKKSSSGEKEDSVNRAIRMIFF